MTEKIIIGKISGASGVRGAVKLFHFSGERERIAGIEELYLRVSEKPARGDTASHSARHPVGNAHGQEPELRCFRIESLRYTGKTPILKLEGVEDRNAAEALVGVDAYVTSEHLAPLDEDSYYVRDLIGMCVADADGHVLGTVKDIIDNPAHDILLVATSGDLTAQDDTKQSEFLLPFVDAFILNIDTGKGVIIAAIPEGLLG
ncbi:MAG: ribosome maturation factor RimM [Clostridiales Family XIII bacterium]|nr:ribosome maturation factor RimM [Clostridiales Family XIII bacterium]